MSLQLRVNRNVSNVYRDIRVRVPKIREQAAVSAVNSTGRKINTAVVRGIARETGIKQQILRGSAAKGIKARVKFYKYIKIRGKARVWAGLSKIPLSKIHTGKRVANGVKKFSKYTAGTMQGRTAADVFTATMPSGHVGHFVRKPGSKRFPIQEVKVDIAKVGEQQVKLNGRTIGPVEFKKEFTRQMTRRLKRL